jgi:hypothetical protein
VAGPHRLPKLPESTLRKQARPNNGSLFCSHCAHGCIDIKNVDKRINLDT